MELIKKIYPNSISETYINAKAVQYVQLWIPEEGKPEVNISYTTYTGGIDFDTEQEARGK